MTQIIRDLSDLSQDKAWAGGANVADGIDRRDYKTRGGSGPRHG
jgi:hypothetical protein